VRAIKNGGLATWKDTFTPEDLLQDSSANRNGYNKRDDQDSCVVNGKIMLTVAMTLKATHDNVVNN
jgi:hypothetical protein